MELGLKGKKAFVMGGSQGIGLGIAQALNREGAKLTLCARGADNLKKAAQEFGAAWDTVDVTQPGAARGWIRDAAKRAGGIDVLVCNTGGPAKGLFSQISSEDWQKGFQNLWMSVVESVQEALPIMQKQKWGRILLVTSVAAREPMPKLTVSNGFRAGLLGMAKSLSHEVASDGITVNCILPGFTDTERLRELNIAPEKITASIPAGRIAKPLEVGDLAAFLASENASYLTGQAIALDGGYLRAY